MRHLDLCVDWAPHASRLLAEVTLRNHAIQQKDQYLGWKTLGAFVLVFFVAWIGGAVWGLGATQIGRLLRFSGAAISSLSLLGIATIRLLVWVPVTRVVLKRRLSDLAFPLHRQWWADLSVGVGMTALAIYIIFVVGVKAGWLVVEGWVWQTLPFQELLGELWVSLLINALVALAEEIIFRAYLLTGLKEAWGQWAGLAVMAVVFGLMHLLPYSAVGVSPLMLPFALLFPTAVGVMFGWAYLRTGSLWLPVGIHFAWDFVENDLLNLSGDLTNPHLIGAVTRLQGPSSMLAETKYGNALVLDTLALAIIFLGTWLWLRRRQG